MGTAFNSFTAKYLNVYKMYVIPSAEYLNDHNDPIFNLVDDNFQCIDETGMANYTFVTANVLIFNWL